MIKNILRSSCISLSILITCTCLLHVFVLFGYTMYTYIGISLGKDMCLLHSRPEECATIRSPYTELRPRFGVSSYYTLGDIPIAPHLLFSLHSLLYGLFTLMTGIIMYPTIGVIHLFKYMYQYSEYMLLLTVILIFLVPIIYSLSPKKPITYNDPDKDL